MGKADRKRIGFYKDGNKMYERDRKRDFPKGKEILFNPNEIKYYERDMKEGKSEGEGILCTCSHLKVTPLPNHIFIK